MQGRCRVDGIEGLYLLLIVSFEGGLLITSVEG